MSVLEAQALVLLITEAIEQGRRESRARAEAAEKALRIAAGLISTMDEHKHKHPEEVLEWVKRAALGREP
jgi:hypothetical protein